LGAEEVVESSSGGLDPSRGAKYSVGTGMWQNPRK
jgi:hypothetical protein